MSSSSSSSSSMSTTDDRRPDDAAIQKRISQVRAGNWPIGLIGQLAADAESLAAELVSLRGQLEAATQATDEQLTAMAREYRNQLNAHAGSDDSAEQTWAKFSAERVLDRVRVEAILAAGGAR